METLKAIEMAVLLATVVYGIGFGVSNWYLGFQCLLTGRKLSQNDLGRILDAAFLMSIAYFSLKFIWTDTYNNLIGFLLGF